MKSANNCFSNLFFHQGCPFKNLHFWLKLGHIPNGHIFVDSPSIRRRNSTWKVRENYIDFERRIHVEIMTSIQRGYFDVDSTFKIDEISMSSPRGFFYVVSTSDRRNFCTRCFHFLTFSALGTYSKLFWYNAESL